MKILTLWLRAVWLTNVIVILVNTQLEMNEKNMICIIFVHAVSLGTTNIFSLYLVMIYRHKKITHIKHGIKYIAMYKNGDWVLSFKITLNPS